MPRKKQETCEVVTTSNDDIMGALAIIDVKMNTLVNILERIVDKMNAKERGEVTPKLS